MPRPWPSSITFSRSIRRNPPAVVTRSYILLKAKQHEQAGAILRKAIEQLKQKKEPRPAVFYLMLAAVENDRPPAATAFDRAIAVLDDGPCEPARAPSSWCKPSTPRSRQSARTQAAVEFVEAKAKAFPKGDLPRELVKVYREREALRKGGPICSATCSRHRPTTPTWPRP